MLSEFDTTYATSRAKSARSWGSVPAMAEIALKAGPVPKPLAANAVDGDQAVGAAQRVKHAGKQASVDRIERVSAVRSMSAIPEGNPFVTYAWLFAG